MNDVNFNIKRNIPSFLDPRIVTDMKNIENPAASAMSWVWQKMASKMTSKTIDIILEHMVYIGIDNRMQVLNMCHIVNLCMIRSLFYDYSSQISDKQGPSSGGSLT